LEEAASTALLQCFARSVHSDVGEEVEPTAVLCILLFYAPGRSLGKTKHENFICIQAWERLRLGLRPPNILMWPVDVQFVQAESIQLKPMNDRLDHAVKHSPEIYVLQADEGAKFSQA
jgi:hypothetical protein